jgi:hypothetical protein
MHFLLQLNFQFFSTHDLHLVWLGAKLNQSEFGQKKTFGKHSLDALS